MKKAFNKKKRSINQRLRWTCFKSDSLKNLTLRKARHLVKMSLPFPSLPFPSLPFPSLPFPSLPFPSLPFPSLPFPSLPFPSLPFPSLPFPSLPFPPLPSPPLYTTRDKTRKYKYDYSKIQDIINSNITPTIQ